MQSKGLSIVFSITTVEKQQFFGTSFPGGSYGKESACNGGDQVQSLGWEDPLEKALEGPLDCKEIQPVHSKGDPSWVFFGRTDAKAETPILWPPHVKS